MRPSDAGPMLPPKLHESSFVVSVFWCLTPPTERMFFDHASARELWPPELLCDCSSRMSWSNRFWSISADIVEYSVVSGTEPQLFDWNTPCQGRAGLTSSPVWL